MATTQFIPSNSTKTINGTSNMMRLLSAQDQATLRSFDPYQLEEVFGQGSECYIPSKGYEDDEWYWVSSKGQVWGIGWRWGQARLRGKCQTNGWDRIPPGRADAAEFVAFLKRELV
jgi:hypothetical protein